MSRCRRLRSAGGVIARDLFQHDDGGWFEDVALLDRLAREKLEAVAAEVRSEGWKWLEVALDFPYGPIPCLLIKRRSYTHGDVMIEYVEGLFRGDAYSYRLNLRA